ncbi:response regulator transcription factor [Yoonia sp. SS1-5]|uniref:LuxR C-terminal-related transcriptional regulator n=1 Tax=Yoonia rhodophyticola TaxID=3137370 RepID=A0AAN0MG80_9RHOB
MQSTVVVADSFELMRSGIVHHIEGSAHLDLICECRTGYETLKLCGQPQPDLLLVDIELDGLNGQGLLDRLAVKCPETRGVAMASDTSMLPVVSMLNVGVSGIVPRQASAKDFVHALYSVANGFGFLPVVALNEIVTAQPCFNKTGNIFGLSSRELEVLEYCVDGKSNKLVAHELRISIRTVETHRANIYKKTKCRDMEALKDIARNIVPSKAPKTPAATRKFA